MQQARHAFCIGCQKKIDVLSQLPLCTDCVYRLLHAQRERSPVCPICLSALRPGGECPVCSRDKEHLIERTFSPYRYRGLVRQLILRFKFQGDYRAAALLAGGMRRAVAGRAFDAVAFVPLHPNRRLQRGFDQAELLALLVADAERPLLPALMRTRDTAAQSLLVSPAARLENIRGAFAVPADVDVQGKTLLLVDDVRTSGATALACARALHDAGAKSVCLLTAAIAPGSGRRTRKSI